jgi:hypothetical protein
MGYGFKKEQVIRSGIFTLIASTTLTLIIWFFAFNNLALI